MVCVGCVLLHVLFFFFFNDTATTEIYTLSLHDALPIWCGSSISANVSACPWRRRNVGDRKSTRLKSSHGYNSYAVFCLKKKKKTETRATTTPQPTRRHLPDHREPQR